MNTGGNYEERMDDLFGEGSMWRHRTLRTLFDPYSQEWKGTDFGQKIQMLKTITSSGESLPGLVSQFKDRYDGNGRSDVSSSVEFALATMLEHQLANRDVD
jgi:hypothetical protein